jgi:hypothetical protein
MDIDELSRKVKTKRDMFEGLLCAGIVLPRETQCTVDFLLGIFEGKVWAPYGG